MLRPCGLKKSSKNVPIEERENVSAGFLSTTYLQKKARKVD
jgi:hypothetical protein